ncbi:hypothetical protein GCM10007907_04240 [Chitinimonas prasina]|uniref:Uncharacterized protein n=1 Tax=Chitinimonas prasina TaxID=1434937 RepID=A0ABQ5YA06_9NEIS|nr:hypothetical protein GCM10007907_04240 [Chitinimonas prasina]
MAVATYTAQQPRRTTSPRRTIAPASQYPIISYTVPCRPSTATTNDDRHNVAAAGNGTHDHLRRSLCVGAG